MVAFVEDELLLVQGVQRASGGSGLGLGDALLPRHEVHLHVGSCGKRPHDDTKWRERERMKRVKVRLGEYSVTSHKGHITYVLR